ncbi:MAG: four helix bundle protein [Chitinophagaceae bacterium]
MTKQEMSERNKQYAIAVARLTLILPYNNVNKNYSNQIIRSSSSSAANYRAALRGKSTPDFINKLKIVEEELDETIFFLELLHEFNPDAIQKINGLLKEGNELLSIIVASLKTLRSNSNKS